MARLRNILAAAAIGSVITILVYLSVSPTSLQVQLISNTDTCLTNCELIFRFRLSKAYTLGEWSKFNVSFRKAKYALDIRSYGIQVLEEVSYNVSVPSTTCYPYNVTSPNGTVSVVQNCTTSYTTQTRVEDVWKDLQLPYSFTRNKWYYIRIWGVRPPKLGPNNIEILPRFLDQELHFTWWNSSWERKAGINITNSGASTLTDYQVAINLTYDSDMVSDFSDIRFVNGSENTELSYWLENKTDSQWAYPWVKVPSIPTGINQNLIYVYYKNATTVSSVSNGINTFLWWNYDGNTTSLVSTSADVVLSNVSGKVRIDATGLASGVSFIYYSELNQTNNFHFRGTSSVITSATLREQGLIHGYISTSNYDYFGSAGSNDRLYYCDGASCPSYVGFTWGNSHTHNVYRNSTTSSAFFDSTWHNVSFAGENGYLSFIIRAGWVVDYDDIRVRKYADIEPTYSIGPEETAPPVDTCTPGTNWNMNCNDNCTKTNTVINTGNWTIYGSNGYFLCNGCNLTVSSMTMNATACSLLFTGVFKYVVG